MRHLLVLLFLFLFLVASPGWAADVWFAECAGTGGAGISTNPYCTDADGDSIDESFENAWDGNATITDVSAGDTIWLCCNGGTGQACDVADSPCTFLLGPSQGADWGPLTPSISGTSVSPITVQNVSGHTVILSGDHDDDNAFDSGTDINRFIETTGEDYIEFQCGTNNIIFQETPSHDDGIFHLAGALGWVFNGCTFRGNGAGGGFDMWAWDLEPDDPSNDSHIFWAYNGGTGADRGKYFKITGTTGTGSLTFQNNLFHHLFDFVFRIIVNNNATSVEVLIDNNEFYNVWKVSDMWNNWDWNTGTGLTVKFTNNYIHDASRGIHWEHLNKGPIVEDNIVLCLGEWQAAIVDNGSCWLGAIDGVENTGGNACSETSGTQVRRNIIGGRVLGDTGSEDCRTDNSGCGWFNSALIKVGAFSCTSSPGPGCGAATGCSGVEENTIIENNMMLRNWPRGVPTPLPVNKSGIYVSQNWVGLKIRNNTVYNAGIGIFVDGIGGEISPDIINNLIAKFDYNGTLDMGIETDGDANGGTTNNNNIYHGGLGIGSTVVADMGGTTYTCSGIGSLGSGNICSQSTMVACNDTHNCVTSFSNTVANFRDNWDLHLDASDTVNKDAGTATGGATDDIDKEARDGSPDIGADELIASTPPPAKLEGDGVLDGSATLAELNGWLDLSPREANLLYRSFWIERTERWRREGKIK